MKPELAEWDRAITEYLTADPKAAELRARVIEETIKAADLGLVKPLKV
jgi:hypothetical protein